MLNSKACFFCNADVESVIEEQDAVKAEEDAVAEAEAPEAASQTPQVETDADVAIGTGNAAE